MNLNIIIKLHLQLFCAFTTCIFMQSCEYFTEPEPFTNNDVIPQEIKQLNLSNFHNGDTVIGTITIEMQPTEQLSKIDYVTIFNDSISFPKISQPPFKFDIDTRWWLNGNHNLFIELYENNYNPGLLRLDNEPSVKYTISLVFKHPPLSPVVYGLANYYPDSTIVKAQWRQYLNADVKYFVIQFYNGYPFNEIFFTDTINSPLINSYVKKFNSTVTYCRVGAGNEYGLTYSEIGYLIGTDRKLY